MKRGLASDNRGLSAVVTTLIIILLVLVAIGIIWVVIRNVVESGAESIDLSTRCVSVDLELVTANETSPGNYSVTLRRNAGGDALGGVKVVVFNDTANSDVLDFGAAPAPLQTVTQTVSAGVTDASKLQYTPYFLDSSGNEQLCPQGTREGPF